MTKIYIGINDPSEIKHIAWINKDGDEESIIKREDTLEIEVFCAGGVDIYYEDLDKLIAALQKAKELGWDKQQQEGDKA